MRHAGAGFGEQANLVIVHMHEMGEPDIAPEVVVIGHPRDRPLAVGRQAELDVGHGLGQVAVNAQAHVARSRGDHPRLIRRKRPGRGRGREGDAAHAVGRGIVMALRAGLDRLDHRIDRLNRRRNDVGRIEAARLGRAAAAEHQTDAQLLGHLEDHIGGIEAIALGEEVMVIGRGRGSRQEKLDQSDPRRSAQRLLVDLVPVGIGHRPQPDQQRTVDRGAHALEDALEQMMVGRDEAGIDDAAGRINHLLARLAFERTDGGNAAVDDADRTGRTHGRAGKPGEDACSALNECRGHASAPTSLSCHWPSASFESPVMIVNSPTPASVMRKSAANMRGISS